MTLLINFHEHRFNDDHANVHISLPTTTILFSIYSEAFGSELLEDIEEMFPRYHMNE